MLILGFNHIKIYAVIYLIALSPRVNLVGPYQSGGCLALAFDTYSWSLQSLALAFVKRISDMVPHIPVL